MTQGSATMVFKTLLARELMVAVHVVGGDNRLDFV